jgi:hypothetical protein
MIGAVDARRLRELLDRHDNLVLLPPSSNNYDVLGKAELVVSVNSKSGAEALLVGTPVVALGDSFYRNSGLVHGVDRIDDIPVTVRRLLDSGEPRHSDREVHFFFQDIWNGSYPGELFVAHPQNAEIFADTMLKSMREDRCTSQPPCAAARIA